MGLFLGSCDSTSITRGCNCEATSISCGVGSDEQPCITLATRITMPMANLPPCGDYLITPCRGVNAVLVGFASRAGTKLTS